MAQVGDHSFGVEVDRSLAAILTRSARESAFIFCIPCLDPWPPLEGRTWTVRVGKRQTENFNYFRIADKPPREELKRV
jgi:hypothetical protein